MNEITANDKIDYNTNTAISEIKDLIRNRQNITNFDLRKIEVNLNKQYYQHDRRYRIHDLLETTLNIYLLEKFRQTIKTDPFQTLKEIEEIAERLPTHSWRDDEQMALQQFSTPPALAFVMSQFLNLSNNKITLEPSAGTGCLALWMKIAGCQTIVNEISERRRELLKIQTYEPFNLNGEFINDLLPDWVKPEAILMNPPFSTNGGRSKKDSIFGFRHIQSALQRLKSGGRLVSLIGKETSLNTNKGKQFWNSIHQQYKIHAFLNIPPKIFYKHGTTYQTVMVIIDKPKTNELLKPAGRKEPEIWDFNNLEKILQYAQELNK